jgi:hypothetical protein
MDYDEIVKYVKTHISKIEEFFGKNKKDIVNMPPCSDIKNHIDVSEKKAKEINNDSIFF